MKIIHDITQMKRYIKEMKQQGKSIGLVPTMGYLHEGHMSLIRRSELQNDVTVVSVFVNPTQFGANEDLDSYPRDLEHDSEQAEEAGADVIFTPHAEDMYPAGFQTFVEVTDITKRLCGVSRPTHFRGVTTVVMKLFHIMTPDRAYFGQKDAQQLLVIRRMVKDLDMDVEIVPCPIIRERDGLAMSSRNTYLSGENRKQAVVLSRALKRAQELHDGGVRAAAALKEEIEKEIGTAPDAQIDYIEIVDTDKLEPVETLRGETLVALAVRFGETRLIDNTIFKDTEG